MDARKTWSIFFDEGVLMRSLEFWLAIQEKHVVRHTLVCLNLHKSPKWSSILSAQFSLLAALLLLSCLFRNHFWDWYISLVQFTSSKIICYILTSFINPAELVDTRKTCFTLFNKRVLMQSSQFLFEPVLFFKPMNFH